MPLTTTSKCYVCTIRNKTYVVLKTIASCAKQLCNYQQYLKVAMAHDTGGAEISYAGAAPIHGGNNPIFAAVSRRTACTIPQYNGRKLLHIPGTSSKAPASKHQLLPEVVSGRPFSGFPPPLLSRTTPSPRYCAPHQPPPCVERSFPSASNSNRIIRGTRCN